MSTRFLRDFPAIFLICLWESMGALLGFIMSACQRLSSFNGGGLIVHSEASWHTFLWPAFQCAT